MRIIAGKWRGRNLSAPPGRNTRPILDRVKTVLFDILGNRLAEPGRLPPVAVLDLFAGSGTLGLEAVSRGARYALFVEQHRKTAALIRSHLDTLEVVDEAAVVEGDVNTVNWPTPPGQPRTYELVFVDPPYRMLMGRQPAGAVKGLMHKLATSPAIDEDALIVVRHEKQYDSGPDLHPLIEQERRDIAKMTLRFMKRPTPEDRPSPDTPDWLDEVPL
jgi:16S rRNA (guanine(966)-N(2))-methyltransferase RsmD